MPDDVFRIVITVAVVLACLAFIVQAIASVGVYRAARKMQGKVEPLVDRAKPVVDRLGATLEKAGPIVDKATPVIENIGATVKKIGPVLDKAVPAVEEAQKVLANANRIIEETRPKISEVTQEAVGIAHEGREQVQKIGELITEASGRARHRLEQIDETVESTVGQVEQVGDSVKRAVMRPVREVNGLAAGISAAVSVLMRGPRKSSVDSATQDEEMFI